MAYYCLTEQLNAHCTLVQSIGGGEIPHVHGATAQVHGATALLPSKLKEESEQVCDALRNGVVYVSETLI